MTTRSTISILAITLFSVPLLLLIFNHQRGDSCVATALTWDKEAGEKDMTVPQLRYLGNPFKPWPAVSIDQRYARNVWDMQLWGDKIYLGYGNSSNIGPAPNAGPVRVITYHPQSECFETEFIVDDEQIDRYRVSGDQLFIPGHDPLDPWDLGNFYYLTQDGWEKVRTIPLAIHTYDILKYQDALYAALGTTHGGAVARSTDSGATWESFLLPKAKRAYELFMLGEELYVHTYRKGGLYRYHGDGFDRLQVDLFPSSQHGPRPMLVRSVLFKEVLLYIGADNVNDHQWEPFAAYQAETIDAARQLDLPQQNLPYDILVRGGTAYILTNRYEEGAFPPCDA